MRITVNKSGEWMPANGVCRMDDVYRIRYMALFPVVIACVLSNGHHYLHRISQLVDYTPSLWHERFVLSLQSAQPEITLVNIIVAGCALLLPVIIVAVIAGGIFERVFSMRSGRAFNTRFIYVAMVFALLIPPFMSVFQVCLGMIFGLLFGREIFGGEGKSFLNPALVGAAFLQIAFPGFLTDSQIWPMINGYAGTGRFDLPYSETVYLASESRLWQSLPVAAALIGGGYLVLKNLVLKRLIAGLAVGVLTAAAVAFFIQPESRLIPWHSHFVWGGIVFAAVFVAADPANASATNAGRWFQGLLAGWLLVLLRSVHPAHPEFTIPVLFLCSMLAPLIDQIVVILHSKLPEKEHV